MSPQEYVNASAELAHEILLFARQVLQSDALYHLWSHKVLATEDFIGWIRAALEMSELLIELDQFCARCHKSTKSLAFAAWLETVAELAELRIRSSMRSYQSHLMRRVRMVSEEQSNPSGDTDSDERE